MANRIPQSFINEVLARTDLVNLIGNRLQLSKKGNNHWACCPFHNEKSPSFSVSQNKQMYHCFGCKASGNALGFLMAFDGMQFLEALEALASPLGMTLPERSTTPQDSDYLPMQALAEQAANHFKNHLKNSPKAIEYLKQRGLTGEIVKTYGIGYAPPGWDNLQRALGRNTTDRQRLIKAGLLISKDNGDSYDRFRDRIMFPIRNSRGQVIAFGGRVIDQGDPKYLNSPESPLFHKRSELYGLYEARQANRKLDRLLIVEGYMDVVALAQHQITYTVATLGTAATIRHIHLMLRYTDELVFCFDGDHAGQQAAWHALEVVLPILRDDITVRFMLLPHGEDPDSLVRHVGAEAFTEQVSHAMSFSEFFFTTLGAQFESDSIEGKAHLAQQSMLKISEMPTGILQSMMIKELGERVNMSEEKLRSFVAPKPRAAAVKRAHPEESELPRVAPAKIPSLMETILSMLIQHPRMINELSVPGELTAINIEGSALLLDIMEICRNTPNINTASLLSHFQDRHELELLTRLAHKEHLMPENFWAQEVNASVKRLIEHDADRESKRLMAMAQRGELDEAGKKRLMALLSR